MTEPVARGQDTSELLERALRATGLSTSTLDIEGIGFGNRKETFAVSPEGEASVVVQLSDAGGLRTEARLLEAIETATAVPVASILDYGTVDGWEYLVAEQAGGENLHDRFSGLPGRVRQNLARKFGRHLGTLHETFVFDGVGKLELEAGALRASTRDWQSWFEQYGADAIERLPAEFDDVRGELRAALDGEGEAEATPRLFPWDFRPGNALAHREQLTAILDWEQPLAAAPALSAAKAEYLVADWYVEESAPLREAFREGYCEVRPWPDVRPAHRIAAIASAAVDSRGTVTNPLYPELCRDEAIQFHREALTAVL